MHFKILYPQAVRLVTAIFFLFVTAGYARSESDTARSATACQIKTAFLYNFVKFIEWPQEKGRQQEIIHLCVIGNGNVQQAFFSLDGRKVKGKTLKVLSYRTVESPGTCQILYVSEADQGEVVPVLKKIADKPVLSVGETDFFSRSGGIIRFYPAGSTIRFAINIEAARKSGIKISSRLLALATIVRSEPRN